MGCFLGEEALFNGDWNWDLKRGDDWWIVNAGRESLMKFELSQGFAGMEPEKEEDPLEIGP